MLADCYELVEELGVWPGGLDLDLVAMLPKGGSDEPGDRRPMVLLPVVYRLWAAARAGPLRDWLKVAGLLGDGGRRRSAESLALGTAVEIAVVRALDLALAGLAVDWSKCYDRLPLGVLRLVADAAGLPEALVGPMLAAYGHRRRVVSKGVAGEEGWPTCGLTPGCPAATDWLVLLTGFSVPGGLVRRCRRGLMSTTSRLGAVG